MLQSYCRAGKLFPDELLQEHALSFVEGMYSKEVTDGVVSCGIQLLAAEVSQTLVYRGTEYMAGSVIFFQQCREPMAGKIVAVSLSTGRLCLR